MTRKEYKITYQILAVSEFDPDWYDDDERVLTIEEMVEEELSAVRAGGPTEFLFDGDIVDISAVKIVENE